MVKDGGKADNEQIETKNAINVHNVTAKESLPEEAKEQTETVEDAIREGILNHRPKGIERSDLVVDAGLTFMNAFSGSGVVITNCKHYSHAKCLNQYCTQQRNAHE